MVGGADPGDHAHVVRVSRGPGVVDGQARGHLAHGVGLSLGLALAVVGGVVRVVAVAAVGDASDVARVVKTTFPRGVGERQPGSHLAQGPGLGLGLPLAVVGGVRVAVASVDRGPVAEGAVAGHEAVAVVHAGDDAAVGKAVRHLAHRVRVAAHGGHCGQDLDIQNVTTS